MIPPCFFHGFTLPQVLADWSPLWGFVEESAPHRGASPSSRHGVKVTSAPAALCVGGGVGCWGFSTWKGSSGSPARLSWA